jgi:hypothetical protein
MTRDTHVLDPYTYILNANREPVPHPNNDAWFKWFGNLNNRRVAMTEISESIYVSTVFIGIDRSYGSAPQPWLFETHIFGGEHDGEERFAATWKEAEKNHAEVVAVVHEAYRRVLGEKT